MCAKAQEVFVLLGLGFRFQVSSYFASKQLLDESQDTKIK
jgi:hypothetical protein